MRFVQFYIRRLRRLLPALFLMLIVVGLLASLLLGPSAQRQQSIAAAMAALWFSNIHFSLAQLDYFAPGAETNLFLHTWSLGVEEQFYLIWPALLAWLLTRNRERGIVRLKVGMSVVTGISLVACVWLSYTKPEVAFYMMPFRAWQFAVGALIWLYFGRTERALPVAPDILRKTGWLGLGLILVASLGFNAQMVYPGAWALIPTVGAAALIATGCVNSGSARVTRLLSWLPLQWLGHISYSWYLWHWPILLLGKALVGSDSTAWRFLWVIVSFVVASVSYVFIETPVRRQRYWLLRPDRSIVGAIALMVIVGALGLNWNEKAVNQMTSPQFQQYVAAHADAPAIYAAGCDSWYHDAEVRECTFGPSAAQHIAVIIGDSHAGQWVPGLRVVFDRPGWRLVVLTKSSCPMVDEPFFYARIGKIYKVCDEWRSHALADVTRLKPDVVFITSALAGFTQRQWERGSAKVLAGLSAASGKVYLIRDTPSLPFDGPGCLAEHVTRPKWLQFGDTCTASYQSSYADQVFQWSAAVAARFPNVRALDLNGLVCRHGQCAAERDGLVVFRDSQHLTRKFAASLGPALATRLELESNEIVIPVDAASQ